MSKQAQAILALLIGWSVLVGTMYYFSNAESAQKIENIEKLTRLKRDLELDMSAHETEDLIKHIEKNIDSLNNIK